jgi:hypothetical protein
MLSNRTDAAQTSAVADEGDEAARHRRVVRRALGRLHVHP